MTMLDLRPEWLRMVENILSACVPDAEVLAYGSRLDGSAHDGSDLDLVVRNPADPGKPRKDLAKLRQAFSGSELPILVDILDWARIPEGFRREILQRCAVVWPTAEKAEQGK